jgi:hypothetical protein
MRFSWRRNAGDDAKRTGGVAETLPADDCGSDRPLDDVANVTYSSPTGGVEIYTGPGDLLKLTMVSRPAQPAEALVPGSCGDYGDGWSP